MKRLTTEVKQVIGKYTGKIYYKFIKTHWLDWFIISVNEGQVSKRWFLPISKNIYSMQTTCVIWYLVPFALTILAIKEFIKTIYLGTRGLIHDWRIYNNQLKDQESRKIDIDIENIN